MREIILDFPNQFSADFPEIKTIKKIKNLKLIIICGMGGSALAGDLLKIVTDFPIIIQRNYGLPAPSAGPLTSKEKNAIVICVSYSGNTEETISSYQEALKNELFVLSLSSGGKLAELSLKNKTPQVKIPAGLPPRSALGYIFNALVRILEKQNIIIDGLKNLAKTIKAEKLEGAGKFLAKKLIGKIPIIYSSEKYRALAYNLKTKFNENTKIPAFINTFPELNHNELVGFQPLSEATIHRHLQMLAVCRNLAVLILRDKEENEVILKRMALTAELIKKNGFEVETIEMEGDNDLEKIFNTSLLGDWISYYLALEYDVNPLETEIIEEFKKKL